MTGGFDAVPAELRGTAGRIDEVIGAGSMKWVGPDLDFGHSAVELAWGLFDQDIERHYDTLIASAAGHGTGLREAAGAYENVDFGAKDVVDRFLPAIDPNELNAGGVKPLKRDEFVIGPGAGVLHGSLGEIDPRELNGGGVKPLKKDEIDVGFSGDIGKLLGEGAGS
ncbi:hypothetical protein [Amycolatopsis sp. lyj-112]|uniref:hypothetical protein n=1 Tax=Amycolatopsis sp. lyj-112 TaxID=2789288 RepID=UPI00397CE2D0